MRIIWKAKSCDLRSYPGYSQDTVLTFVLFFMTINHQQECFYCKKKKSMPSVRCWLPLKVAKRNTSRHICVKICDCLAWTHVYDTYNYFSIYLPFLKTLQKLFSEPEIWIFFRSSTKCQRKMWPGFTLHPPKSAICCTQAKFPLALEVQPVIQSLFPFPLFLLADSQLLLSPHCRSV